MRDHSRFNARQAASSISPLPHQFPGSVKNLMASVLPKSTKLTCRPEHYSPYQTGPEDGQLKCPSRGSDSGPFPRL